MSLMLKGIDMPSKNQSIVIEIKPNGKCPMMKIEKGECYELTTKGEAEAIQIPKGHGRLIDADALELEKEVKLADDWKTAHEIANCVKYAPTILEAEE